MDGNKLQWLYCWMMTSYGDHSFSIYGPFVANNTFAASVNFDYTS